MHGAEPLGDDGERSRRSSVLEQGLVDHMPGFRVVDRDLEIEALHPGQAPLAVDLVGLDADGRLVIAISLHASESDPVRVALQVLTWSRCNGGLFAEQFVRDGAAPASGPLVVLAVERFDDAQRAALEVLRADDLLLFETRRARSARGAAAWLVRIDLGRAPGTMQAVRVEDVLASLPEPGRTHVASLRRRLTRIDPRLATHSSRDGLAWSVGGNQLVAISASEGIVRAACDSEVVVLESPADVEHALHCTLVAYFARHTSDALAADEDEPRAPRGLLPSGPLLTAEEIAAFRD